MCRSRDQIAAAATGYVTTVYFARLAARTIIVMRVEMTIVQAGSPNTGTVVAIHLTRVSRRTALMRGT